MNTAEKNPSAKIGEVTLSNEHLKIIEQIVNENKNILIVGDRGSGKTSLIDLTLKLMHIQRSLLVFDFHDEISIPSQFEKTLVVGYGERTDLRLNPHKRDIREFVNKAILLPHETIVFDEIYGAEGDGILSQDDSSRNLILSVTSTSVLDAIKSIVLNTPFPTTRNIPIHLLERVKNNFDYGITITDKIKIEKIIVKDNLVCVESM